jgi:hypothetical protein
MSLINEVQQLSILEEDIKQNGEGFKAEDLRSVMQSVSTLNEQKLSEPLEADEFLEQMRAEGLLTRG